VRDDDLGVLWEHFVLNEIMARAQNREVFYWRDKRGHEVDFVLAARRKKPVALECKWSANNFDPKNLIAFRHQHPEGDNLVIAHDVDRAFSRSYGDLRVRFEGLRSFADLLSS
jgi:predicted AAA+ superfamily ATPase